MIDLEAVRADTPGCLDSVFLDSAGSSLPPQVVVSRTVAHLHREAEVGGYRAAAEQAGELAALPESLGRLLGCPAETLALTDSATRAWTQLVTALPLGPGDRVLITGIEYASNAIALLQRAMADGVSIEVVPSDVAGRVDLAALGDLLDERVRLVSLVHVPTNSGLVNEVRQVADLVHEAGALVLLDACQSVGQLSVDVDALGVDALSATGRKWLRGPRGTGFLHVRRGLLETLEPAAADMRGATWTSPFGYALRSDARRFELWESNVAGLLGLKAAVDYLLELGVAWVEQSVRTHAAYLRDGLGAVKGVTVRDAGPDLSGIVSFTIDGIDPERVRDDLVAAGVTVSVSVASSTLLDMTARGLDSVVRASPHYFVAPSQLDEAIAAVSHLSEAARRVP